MVGVPTGSPQSRDVPTGSCMAEMFLLRYRMVGVPTGLPQSRDVPTGSCMAEMFLLRYGYLPDYRKVGMYLLVHVWQRCFYCGTGTYQITAK